MKFLRPLPYPPRYATLITPARLAGNSSKVSSVSFSPKLYLVMPNCTHTFGLSAYLMWDSLGILPSRVF